MKGVLVSDGCSFNVDKVPVCVLCSGGGLALAGSMSTIVPSVTSTPDIPLEPTQSVGQGSCPSSVVSNDSIRAFGISAVDPCVLSVGLPAPPAYLCA